MTELDLTVFPSRGRTDDEPDTIVIESASFEHIPQGLRRHITVWAFFVGVDRLVLRVPENLTVTTEYNDLLGATDITVGDTLVTVLHPPIGLDQRAAPMLDRNSDSLVIETVAVTAQPTEHLPDADLRVLPNEEVVGKLGPPEHVRWANTEVGDEDQPPSIERHGVLVGHRSSSAGSLPCMIRRHGRLSLSIRAIR